jgi:hypothetical protein
MTRPNLRDEIARELKPTRPLRRPLTRAFALVPIAAVIVVGVPMLHAFRDDMGTIGFLRAWGFSIAQTVAGLTIVAVAFREAIPGRAVSAPVLAATFVAGIVLPGVILVMTTSHFDVGPSPGSAIPEGIACFRVSALAAVPALVLAGVLAARAFPLRPGAAGGLYGLGSGLTADAGLRLFCDYSTPGHVVFGHIGAVAATAVIGAAGAWAVERFRKR